MTIDNRYVADLQDILAVHLECKRCGASVMYPVANWKATEYGCPNCRQPLLTEQGIFGDKVEALREVLETLGKESEGAHVRVRLVFSKPEH